MQHGHRPVRQARPEPGTAPADIDSNLRTAFRDVGDDAPLPDNLSALLAQLAQTPAPENRSD